jgi:hypothetical protein
LAENWVGPSNARTVNWQATDCVPLAHVELQTVLELFTAASCNVAACFESLLVSTAPGFRLKTGFGPAMSELSTGKLLTASH